MAEKEARGSTKLALKAGAWYVISTFLVKSLSFITTPIFSRLMDKTSYGEFSNYASWQTTLLVLTGAELYNTVNRAYYDHKEDFDKYVSSVSIAAIGFTALVYLVFLFGGDWIYNIVSIPREFVHMMFFTLTFQSCKQIYLARERTLYRYKSVAAISVFNALVPTLISVVMVVLAEQSLRLPARIYGFYGPSTAVGILCGAVLLYRGRGFKVKHCTYAFKLSLPLLVHYLTAYMLTSTNVIVTKNVLGADTAALVSITTSATTVLTLLLQSISGAVTTWLMDCLEQKKYKTARKGLFFYVAGISALSLALIFVSPEIILVLGGSKYAAATELMPGLILAAMIQAVTTVFTIILTYEKRVIATAWCTAVVAIMSIAAKVYLLPVYGVNSLAWINAIAFAVLFVCGYFLVKRTGESASVVNLKGFVACVALVLGVALAAGLLYQNTLVRWGIIAVAGIATLVGAYIKRDLILGLLKKRKKAK